MFFNSQPIIDYSGEIVAYNLFCAKDSDNIDEATISMATTFSVSSLNHYNAIIDIDDTLLHNNILKSLSPNIFILSFEMDVIKNIDNLPVLKELKSLGFRLSMTNPDTSYLTLLEKHSEALHLLDFIKIQTTHQEQIKLKQIYTFFKPYNLKQIATNVDTNLSFAIAKSIGFDYVLGFYYSEPVSLENKKIDAKLLNIVRLYNMLQSKHTTTKELSHEFESNPQLTIELLKYINSGAFYFRSTISSIEQSVSLLGRKPLAQWLLALMYAKQINNSPTQSILMSMVTKRASMMKDFAKLLQAKGVSVDHNEAFLVGIMSLSENITQAPIRYILKEMHLSENVSKALLENSGILGEILTLAKDIEHSDREKVYQFIKHYNIDYAASIEIINTTFLESKQR